MSNSSSSAYITYLNKLGSDIQVYFNIVSWSVGIPCNILSIFIFARLMRNKNNMGFLYIWQCSVDLSLLLLFLFLFRSATTLGINLYIQNDSTCKFLNILRRFILHASSWMPVLTTFDRFTFVLYGHADRFIFIKSKVNLTCIILISFVIITVVNIPNLYFYVMKSSSCNADFIPLISSDIISICMRTFFPLTLMLVFNLFMIRKIYNSNRAVAKQTSLSRKETHFTITVIAFDVYFFILNFPLALFYIFYDTNLYSGAIQGDALFSASYGLVAAVTANLSFCVQTFSFFMYLAFNKVFRNELVSIISRIACIQSLASVQPSQTNHISNTLLPTH